MAIAEKTGVLTSTDCLACGAPVSGQYCAVCGQKHDDMRRSLFLLARNFIEETFFFDSRMWRTLGSLARSPGTVPADFSHGRRSRYTPPIRLFLVVSFIFFLTVGFTNTLFVAMEMKFRDVPVTAENSEAGDGAEATRCSFNGNLVFFKKEEDIVTDMERLRACMGQTRGFVGEAIESADDVKVGADEGQEVEAQQAEEIVDRVFDGIEWAVTDPRGFNNAVNLWLPRTLFFMTPVLALILGMFLRRDVLIFDHMVLALYVHAVNFTIVGLSLILAQLGAPFVGVFAAVAIALYYVAAIRRAYGRGWVKTLWTAIASGALYALVFFITLSTIVSRVVWQAAG